MNVRTEDSPFSALGFAALEEELYRTLLRTPAATFGVLAQALGTTAARLREAVVPLADAGLVEVDGEQLTALPPDVALSRLINQEAQRVRTLRDHLDGLRVLVPELTAEHHTSRAPVGDPIVVERVEGGDVVTLVRDLSATTTGDMLWLRPDQWRYPPGRAIDDWISDLIASGRPSRALYPARVLEEAPEVVRGRAEAGEQVRLLAEVPCRVAILGAEAALISESFGVNDDRRLVIRHNSMIGVLTLLFENLWERAVPVPGLEGLNGEGVTDRRLLLDQMAAGAKDEQIARALGLSLRTVRRRVAAVLEELGADSRFQAGVEAARRGWL